MPLILDLAELAANYHARSLTDCFGNSTISISAINFNAAKGIQQMEALN
jgi:hypothetical protein